MIVSNSKKFIFFHVPKTGGTSVAYNLCKYSENLDEFYPHGCKRLQEVVDILEKYYPNIEGFDKTHDEIQEVVEFVGQIALRNTRCNNKWYQKNWQRVRWMNLFHFDFDLHPVMSRIPKYLHYINHAKHEGYYKFGFVRNPWDYVFSAFKNRALDLSPFVVLKEFPEGFNKVYLKNKFNNFIRNYDSDNTEHHNVVKNFINITLSDYLYDCNGNLLVDEVFKYEDFDNSVKKIYDNIGLDDAVLDAHLNRTVKTDYKDYYEEDNIETIAKIFEKDIENFSYTF